jgi:phosphoglycerate-specific signal transduction histidine kinase
MDQLRQKVANLESLLKEEIETKATAFRPLHKEQQNLQKLNQSLEKRVAEEVQKNRDKDRIMYQQSRLAQMGEMISMIAHQWRQPLSSINAIGVNLKLKALLSEENSQYVEEVIPQLEKIESIVQYMSSTIDDFRNFYRPNKEQVQITLNTPLKKAVQLMKATLNSHDITVHEIYHSVHQHAVFDGVFSVICTCSLFGR